MRFRILGPLEVRGAPAIGCAGAFAVALLARHRFPVPELRRRMREIVESYGGKLTVQTCVGTGTTFTFDLPR